MKKITGLIAGILLLVKILAAQNTIEPGYVVQQINEKANAGVQFVPVNVFASSIPMKDNNESYLQLTLNDLKLKELFNSSAAFIELTLPALNGGEMKLLLMKHDLLTDDFVVSVTEGSQLKYAEMQGVVFYKGIIKGNNNSIVAITVFENEINGVISDNTGNINLGKKQNHEDVYVMYNDKTIRLPFQFECGNASDNDTEGYKPDDFNGNKILALNKCVKILFDCDYDFYLNKGSVANVSNYVVSLFNVMGTLYSNESITISIKEIHVWATPDGYCSASSTCGLNSFMAQYANLNGANLGHVLTMDAGGKGGLASAIGAICNGYAYSDIDGSFNNFPTYSWDAMVVTHETGHDLNSRHTHACVWNGNSTSIDGCGQLAGYSEGTCATGPVPALGGTIMSYCHLNAVGINFNRGFGPQPGSVIRSYVASQGCLTTCTSECLPVIFIGNPILSGNSGTYTSSNVIYADTLIQSGANVQLQAQNLVLLSTGFIAQTGATFRAYNAACTPLMNPSSSQSANLRQTESTSLKDDKIQMMPNPFTDEFSISMLQLNQDKIVIEVFDALGNVLLKRQFIAEQQGFQTYLINTQMLPSGMYLVKVTSNDKTTMRKMVKQ